jgi:hypothetical protein
VVGLAGIVVAEVMRITRALEGNLFSGNVAIGLGLVIPTYCSGPMVMFPVEYVVEIFPIDISLLDCDFKVIFHGAAIQVSGIFPLFPCDEGITWIRLGLLILSIIPSIGCPVSSSVRDGGALVTIIGREV